MLIILFISYLIIIQIHYIKINLLTITNILINLYMYKIYILIYAYIIYNMHLYI